MVRDIPPSQDASTHQIWNSYLKEYRRYAPDTKRDGRTDRRTGGHFTTIKTKSEVKVIVTVTRKWYATLPHPKMHPHTKFGTPTSKNIGDMHRTRSGTDGRTVRLLYASQSSFGDIKKCSRTIVFDWHKLFQDGRVDISDYFGLGDPVFLMVLRAFRARFWRPGDVQSKI